MNDLERQARTQEVFLSALDIPFADRETFLEQACRDDARLRQEVESLLQHHHTGTLLGTPLAPSYRTRGSTLGAKGLARTILQVLGGSPLRVVAFVLAAAVLAAVAYFTRERVRQSSTDLLRDELRVVLNSDVLAVETWIDAWKRETRLLADNPLVRSQAERLINQVGKDPERARKVKYSPEMKAFTALFEPYLKGPGQSEVVLIDPDGLRLGSGFRNSERAAAFLVPVLEGETRFAPPSRLDEWALGRPADSRVLAFVATPLRDSKGNIFSVLASLRTGGYGLGDLLNVARIGSTGETYAISTEGLLLSESRFVGSLKKIGLVPDAAETSSALTVQIRDPGGDMTKGYKPTVELEARPLTLIARLASASRGKPVNQQTGAILVPYRDYRGVDVIGAWRWLPEHDFGVVTEVDAAEAFAPLESVSMAFYALFGTIGSFVALTLIGSFSLARSRRRKPRVGQYFLSKQIGEGGTSKVYLVQHALLRRPTAVKVLTLPEELPDEAIHRFEREVQAACRLTHPNTIEIYDFGRTPDGSFFYAMEYLPGVTLADLISMEGPIPPGRVIYILKQVCASLREAHGQGFVHRDIKPQNIMICERGGEYDFVKVLDFGLVWNLQDSSDMRITKPQRIIGTPLYMAPERFSRPLDADVRSDIYSLGAVGFHLLSGRPLFRSVNDLDLLGLVMHGTPDRLSEVVSSPIPPPLERLVMDCVSRELTERPQSVVQILETLNSFEDVAPWTQEMAKAWWAHSTPAK